MIAWKYTTDFNKENHLFYKTIDTNYLIEAFSCSCGHTNFIIKYEAQDIDYICPECENDIFYDANIALSDIKSFVKKNQLLDTKYPIEYHNNEVTSKQVLKVPIGIDFLKDEIIFSEKPIYIASLNNIGDICTDYSILDKNQITILENKMIKFIYDKNILQLPKRTCFIHTVKDISIMIKRRSLNLDNLNYINRREKSIKRVIYKTYQQLNDFKQESYLEYVAIFMRDIKDPNLLLKLLDISNLKGKISFYNEHALSIKATIYLLKQYQYTEKQIVKFLLTLKEDYLIEDTLNELKYIVDNKIEGFKKVPCIIDSLHNEAINCSQDFRNNKIKSTKLLYTETESKVCINIKNYKVKLPQNGGELIEWADTLQNCIVSYFDMIKNNETVIYGFFDNDILQFAVEISEGKMIQASGKHNSPLEPEEQEVLDIWMKRFFKYKNGLGMAA